MTLGEDLLPWGGEQGHHCALTRRTLSLCLPPPETSATNELQECHLAAVSEQSGPCLSQQLYVIPHLQQTKVQLLPVACKAPPSSAVTYQQKRKLGNDLHPNNFPVSCCICYAMSSPLDTVFEVTFGRTPSILQ